ncbi:MAG: hypothetical protein DRQ55_12845 [Planctomycetota bacterium]|nr:MAG: hypothetical protein DRQ55_12845 [Planctomycetota bacterium]
MSIYEPPAFVVVEQTSSAAFAGQASVALVVTSAVAVGTWVVALTQTSRSLRKYVNVMKQTGASARLKAVTLAPDAKGKQL